MDLGVIGSELLTSAGVALAGVDAIFGRRFLA